MNRVLNLRWRALFVTAILDALHLSEDDMLAGLPIQVATTGHSKVMIPLKPEVDLDALSPDLPALTAISQQIGCNGFFPFKSARAKTPLMAACFHLLLVLWKTRLRQCQRSNGRMVGPPWVDGA